MTPRYGQDAERERVEHLDSPRAAGVGRAEQLACRFEDPIAVGMLDDHGGHVVADLWVAAPALLHGEDLGLVARSPTVGPKGFEISGIDRLGDQDPVPARRGPGQVDRLRQGGGPVVQRGVRHLEARELADHRLVLEQGLQHPLRQLRLIRGV
jgi:hypothetical protein